MEESLILEVQDLKQYFKLTDNITVKAVDGVSFSVAKGEIFGLVGESGCGKSTIARAISGICKPTSGKIIYRGIELSDRKIYRKNKKDIQRSLQIVFQDSSAALNPRMTVENLILEPLRLNRLITDKEQARAELERNMERVELDIGYLSKYPAELSGGQRQRVAIARSLSLNPEFVIADEPISSLDISIQAQIITLFKELQKERGFSFLFIAHNLSVIRYISNTVGVMLQGRLVETAPTAELFRNPLHPYTRSLLSAVHVPDPIYERNKKILYYDRSRPLGEKTTEVSPGHFVLEY